MPVTITHSTLADGTFSATGAAAWDATHTVSGLGTMAEQNSNNVNITGGSITGVTGVLSSLTVGTTATSGGAAGQIMFDTGSVLQESSALTFASNTLQINGANILGGTNSFTLGGAAAASPSAQTLRAQSVVAGTTNTAGANLTITGSQGTGTGAGGSIIFQVAPAGSSGTAQNALATALTIAPTGLAGTYTFTGGTGSGTSTDTTRVTFNNISANSFKNQFDMSGAGAVKWAFGNDINGNKGDNFYIYSASGGAGGTVPFYIDGSTRQVGIFSGANVHVFGFWNNTSGISAGTLDVILSRRGAANLRFGNADAAAPVAQTLSVQSVVAGTSNTAGANLTITGSQGTGTGAGGSIIFQVAPAGSSGTAQNALSDAFHIFPSSTKTAAAVVNASTTTVALGVSVSSTPVGNCGFTIGDANTFGLACNNNQIIVRIRNTTVDATAGGIDVWGRIGISTSSNGVADAFFTRRGAANLRFGAADAAAPVAQTLSVQSVVAGTSNTAGANLTITGSQGTGTGAGGSIIFQVAPAGSTGTAQNALATALTIDSTGKATFAPTTNSTNSFAITNLAGSIVASVDSTNRRFNAGGGAGAASLSVSTATGNTTIYNAGSFGWTDGSSADTGTFNLILSRRGAANLRFGAADAAAPVAQTLSVQSVVAGTSNTAGANLTITGSQGTGTGAGGDIVFQVATAGTSGTSQNALAAAWTIKSTKVTQQALLTVATLPTGAAGMRAFVSDSSVAGSGNFGATVAGGGANNVPVYFDGTNWCIG